MLLRCFHLQQRSRKPKKYRPMSLVSDLSDCDGKWRGNGSDKPDSSPEDTFWWQEIGCFGLSWTKGEKTAPVGWGAEKNSWEAFWSCSAHSVSARHTSEGFGGEDWVLNSIRLFPCGAAGEFNPQQPGGRAGVALRYPSRQLYSAAVTTILLLALLSRSLSRSFFLSLALYSSLSSSPSLFLIIPRTSKAPVSDTRHLTTRSHTWGFVSCSSPMSTLLEHSWKDWVEGSRTEEWIRYWLFTRDKPIINSRPHLIVSRQVLLRVLLTKWGSPFKQKWS